MASESAKKFSNLELRNVDSIAVLTVQRPKALNALNREVLTELCDALRWISQNRDLRCLVFTGGGDKAFIAGADISEMSQMKSDAALEFSKLGQEATQMFEALPIPAIAAVNGYALGGGCEFALACDFVIASEKALFGQPEVSLGLVPGFGGMVRLAEYVGWPMARDMILSGRKIGAEEALRIGLANRVLPAEGFLEAVILLAKEIAANSPRALRDVKRTMLEIRSVANLTERLDCEAQKFSQAFGSQDQVEGTKAFLEKRKAQWTPSF